MRVLVAPYPHQYLVLFWALNTVMCTVVAHFNLQVPNDDMGLLSFHVCVWHLCIFFGEVSVQTFCPFFNSLAHFPFKSCLYFILYFIFIFIFLFLLDIFSANVFP